MNIAFSAGTRKHAKVKTTILIGCQSKVVRMAVLCLFFLQVTSNIQAQISPSIVGPPRSQTNWAGNNVILGAVVTGTPPFSYQWFYNGTQVPGQTNALLLLPMTTTNDTGSYSLSATNISGSVTSSPAIVRINPVPESGVVAWGDNDSGLSTVPTGMSKVVSIAAGYNFTLASESNGTVVAWGNNIVGQTNVPVGLSGVVSIAADGPAVALKSDGTVVVWGDNSSGQTNVPPGLSGVVSIAAGSGQILALKSDGTVVAWGYNAYGEATVPAGLNGVIAIAAGGFHSVALKSDGTVVAWGLDNHGQADVPADLSGVTAIAAGGYHTIALKIDGSVTAWGYNDYDQTTVPAGLSGVTAIAGGWLHSIALKSNGTAVAWGTIGTPNYGQTTVPPGLVGVTAIAAGGFHNVALSPIAGHPIYILVDRVFVPDGAVVRNLEATIGIYSTFTNAAISYSIEGTDPLISRLLKKPCF